jgi:SPP1 gp7 family putative phage head morphogenesis protein
MADAVQLSTLFDMEPKDAVSYLKSKGYVISDRWFEVLTSAHAKSFTVAKAMRLDILETIRGSLDEALASGMTERDFVKQLTPELQKAGWWGKQTWVDGSGNARTVQLGSPHRLKTIYRTNMQTSFMAGRYRRYKANADAKPYWMYVAVLDGNTRPEHRKLNGRVFRHDDPIWSSLFPPNGWGCRCRVRALSEAQVKRMGLTVESSEGYLENYQAEAGVDERTGEVSMVDQVTVTLPRVDGKPGGKMTPDVGWAYNPGEAAYGADMMTARKIATAKSSDLRAQVIQALNNSEQRQAQFMDWADQVLEKRRPGNGVQTLAFMPEDIHSAVTASLGVEATRLMVISEKGLVHADSQKHQDDDVAVKRSELQALIRRIGEPEAVLRERKPKGKGVDILLIYPSEDDRKVKLVLRLNNKLKKQSQPMDEVVNLFKVGIADLTNKGLYEVLQGEITP